MEQTISSGNSKWSLAARDGLILASVTVVVSTLTFLTKNSILSTLLWFVKLGGSFWLLSVIMKRYGNDRPGESTFSYGLIVCVLSSLVCAVWSLVEYKFLFPDTVSELFEQMHTSFGQMGSTMPEEFTDILLKMEDNYAQINCIATFIRCTIFGLIFSAIIARTGRRKPVFTDEEMKRNQNDEFNF